MKRILRNMNAADLCLAATILLVVYLLICGI